MTNLSIGFSLFVIHFLSWLKELLLLHLQQALRKRGLYMGWDTLNHFWKCKMYANLITS